MTQTTYYQRPNIKSLDIGYASAYSRQDMDGIVREVLSTEGIHVSGSFDL